MLRIGLFLLTNAAIIVVFSIVLSLLGIDAKSMSGLLIFAALFGFGGSFISLMLSKTIALHSVGAEIIEKPRNARETWLFRVVERQSKQVGITPQISQYTMRMI